MDIILVHGFGDSGRRFAPLQRQLTAAGHRCYCPTLETRRCTARYYRSGAEAGGLYRGGAAARLNALCGGRFLVWDALSPAAICNGWGEPAAGLCPVCHLAPAGAPGWPMAIRGRAAVRMRRGSAFLQQLAQSVRCSGLPAAVCLSHTL